MMTVKDKIEILAKTPHILKELISEIPDDILNQRRIKGKWSIREHTCHLCESQGMMLDRFNIFKNQKHPIFTAYLPGSKENPTEHLSHMDLNDCLQKFKNDRKELIDLLT